MNIESYYEQGISIVDLDFMIDALEELKKPGAEALMDIVLHTITGDKNTPVEVRQSEMEKRFELRQKNTQGKREQVTILQGKLIQLKRRMQEHEDNKTKSTT